MSNKKLNLSKYAYLDFLKGDIFAWLTCNENFLIAAEEDSKLRASTPWRYDETNSNDSDSEIDVDNAQRYGFDLSKELPDQMKAGIRVGEYSKAWAKSKYPNHKVVEINKQTNLENVEYTKQMLEEDNIIIFEATFGYNDFHIRTDLLVKTNDEVKVIEVKATTSPKEIHAYDIFFQKEIIERSNPEFKDWDYSLLILNKEYRHSIKYTEEEVASMVFVNIDYTSNGNLTKRKIETGEKVSWTYNNNIHFFNRLDNDEEYPSFIEKRGRSTIFTFPIKDFFDSSLVRTLQEEFDNDLERIKEIQLLDKAPLLEFEARNNKFMSSDYMVWALDYSGAYDCEGMSIFELRGFNFSEKLRLREEGKISINDATIADISPKIFQDSKYENHDTLPLIEDFLKLDKDDKSISKYSTIIQKHFFDKEDELKHKEGIAFELSKYTKGPIYMYDFETANLAIPVADYTKPYEQVVYQYSIHVITDPSDFDFETMKNVIHYEWLAKDRKNFHTEAWEEFVKVFKTHGKGTYVAWNKSFEEGCLKRSQTHTLDDEGQEIIEEIVNNTDDLMIPFRKKYYYNRELKGSYSIKYAGPHFAPDINYKELNNVQRGDQSAAVAKRWLRENSSESEASWEEIRKDMLKYCEYDTLLMVAIFQRMKERLG